MKIYADGYLNEHNPSHTGGGFVVMDENKELLCSEEIDKNPLTNNEAELRGVAKAIELANEGDTVITDSNVALCWIKYRRCKARKDLKDIACKAHEEMEEKFIILRHEGRKKNLAGNFIEFVLKK
jgi:ribonuclease HI